MKLDDVILLPGTRGAQPAAATVPAGTLYCVTDENRKLERSTGAAWEAFSPASQGLINDGNSAGALNFDFLTGARRRFVLTGNAALTFTNPTDGVSYVLVIGTGAGGFNPTWPVTVLWPAGVTPVVTAAAGKVDIVTLLYVASSASYYASIQQNY